MWCGVVVHGGIVFVLEPENTVSLDYYTMLGSIDGSMDQLVDRSLESDNSVG